MNKNSQNEYIKKLHHRAQSLFELIEKEQISDPMAEINIIGDLLNKLQSEVGEIYYEMVIREYKGDLWHLVTVYQRRTKRLIEVEAPKLIIMNEIKMFQIMLNYLEEFLNGENPKFTEEEIEELYSQVD
jgi:hypothetical protein